MDPGIISKIVERNLLAKSPSKLAAALGYSGRSTVSRLQEQKCGDDAMHTFCQRLNDIIGLGTDDIITVGQLMDFHDEFATQMKQEMKDVEWPIKFDIALAFIDDNYSIFSESYRQLSLNKWLLLKGYEKDMFFNMLSLFLLNDKNRSYYSGGAEPIAAFKRILEPLQKQLHEKYPNNAIGNTVSTGILETPLARLAYPCFLTLVRLCGVLLKGYVSNYSEVSMHDSMIKIPQLPDRSFWNECEDKNEITFLKYIPVNGKGNGLYEYFTYNFQSGKTENPAQFYFYTKNDLGLFLKRERRLLFGNYDFTGSSLHLKLYIDRIKISEFRWERLYPERSERIREINRLFTDGYINNVRFGSLGIELSCGIIINEVIVSKSKIILLCPDGKRLSIARDSYPFLQSVTPDTVPFTYLDRSDGKIYIEWEEFGCRIAVEEFSR